jgi:hypothetical protein
MEGPPLLPKCHPTIKGGWAHRPFQDFQRGPGDIFDLTYHGDDGNEIAFMPLIVQPDGVTLRLQTEDVTQSHSAGWRGDHGADARNRELIRAHYGKIKKELIMVAHRYEARELVPMVGGKATLGAPICPTCHQCIQVSK